MESLPNELIEKILCNKSIGIYDLCQFSLSSVRYSIVVRESNEIWKKKFQQNYNRLFNNQAYQDNDSIDWKQEIKTRFIYGKVIREQISSMSKLYYHEEELSNDDFNSFVNYYQNENPHPRGSLFQIDELESILDDGQPTKNLTDKYYTAKVLRFLRHEILKDKFRQLFDANDNLNEGNDLFHGAVLLSSWFNTNSTINQCHYRRQIELIAQVTIDLLIEKYPNNQLLRNRANQCLTDEEALKLSESLWSSESCHQILLCLNEVMFTQLRFDGNEIHYYSKNNSFINHVFDSRIGIPITLCILYLTIACKLGVKTHPVNYPGHFLIKWKQYPK